MRLFAKKNAFWFTVLTCLSIGVHILFSVPMFAPNNLPGNAYVAFFYPYWMFLYFFGAQVFHGQASNTADIWWNVILTIPLSVAYGTLFTWILYQISRKFTKSAP